jgi:alkylhydroperoxidase/carboxymuconolactone decarboxylase family protein YurZ
MFAKDLCHSQIEYFRNVIDLDRKDRAKRYNKSSIFNLQFRFIRVGYETFWALRRPSKAGGERPMYLPQVYESFAKKYPQVLKDYQQLGKSCRTAGPLEEKYQDLIKLGIAIGANSRGAVMSAVRKALAAGATPEEISQSVLLALTTTGFPNMIAAMGWVNEVLEKQD